MISGIEMRMLGETSRAVTGMSRKKANELAVKCLEKYEPTLGNPPKGKRLQDLYDIEKLKVKEEWLAKFKEVKAQLKDWGMPYR